MTEKLKSQLQPDSRYDLLKQVVDSMADSVFFKDLDGRYLGCNQEYEKLIGRTEAELLGKTAQQIYGSTLPESYVETDRVVMETKKALRFEAALTKADGTECLFESSKSPLYDKNGEMIGILGVLRDITKQKEAEEALKISEEKYRMIAENTTDTIWLYNMDQERFTYISPAILQLRGYTVEEALSQTLLDTVAPGSLEGVAKGVADARDYLLAHPDEPISHTVEIQQTTKSGDPVWVEVSVKLQFNDQGEATVLGVSRNIEDRKRAESEILYLGYHDQLTGLYNRHYFETIINGEMDRADRYKEPLSMLLLDLDHFKAVNDTWGHLVGDDLLKTMSAAIQKEIRSTDTLVRYGGEELIILMPHTTKAGALLVADKIQAAIKINPHHTAGIQTVSIGVAQRMQSESFRHLYIRLDHALYQAKENGRDCVVASDERIQIPSDQMRIEWRSVWESGNTIIDTQHKELLQIANNLLDLTSSAYICQDEEEKIDLLLKHIEKHFEAEEKILEQIGFPNYEKHVAVHQSLLLRVSGLNRNCGNGEINTAAFYSFVVDDVVLGHLLEDDIKFFPYL